MATTHTPRRNGRNPTDTNADLSASGDADASPVVIDGRIEISRTRTALIIAPHGVFDAHSVDELDAVLERWPGVPVVIDLDNCTLVERAALDGLDPARWDRSPEQTCIASSRGTARELLARARVVERFAVFNRVADAVQARILADSGYGAGWRLHRA